MICKINKKKREIYTFIEIFIYFCILKMNFCSFVHIIV